MRSEKFHPFLIVLLVLTLAGALGMSLWIIHTNRAPVAFNFPPKAANPPPP